MTAEKIQKLVNFIAGQQVNTTLIEAQEILNILSELQQEYSKEKQEVK